jgi:predicted Zn finger-like uncharacterized protein
MSSDLEILSKSDPFTLIFATEQRIIMPDRFPNFNNGATTMPTIQCPHCSHEARVPSLEQIAGKNVKCPSCSQTFHVQAETPAPAVNTGNDFAFQDQSPQIAPPQPHSRSVSLRSRRKESLFSPLIYDPNGATSSQRYPNLMRYLVLSETLITLLFRISMALLAIAFVLSEIGSLFAIRELGLLLTLVGMVGMVILAALLASGLWLWFITSMAILEFLRVTVDIENNTRG